ncbi:MAG TPA: sugar MFS transporter [Puia sp.]|nr:sugar MFS transporter [Puia sp.]
MRSNKPIFIIGILFFVFGFVTWLGSVLIPYLRIACQLNNLASYFVAFSFYISYMVMAIPAASVLKVTGYKKGMSLGLFIMAAGALLFLPAAQTKSYPLFLTGLFVQGTGLALLQTASNPYITILGPLETAAKRISIMGICNGVAGAVAPLILGAVILKDADGIKDSLLKMNEAEKTETLNSLAHRVIFPYSIMVVVLMMLALLVLLSGLPEMNAEAEDEEAASINTNKTSIFQFPHLLLGVLTLFLYVGVEVIAGDTIINYGASQGIPISSAKFFTSCTLSLMLAGYVIGIILIPRYLSQVQVLRISAVMGLIFASVALLTKGYVSVAFVALLGLANSMIWPSIWPLAINKLGKFTKIGSSFLIVAVGGGAILPLLYGWLADFKFITPHYAYIIVLPCYFCILFYALKGHKMGLQQ